jgi:hypothetical protein
MGAAAVTQAMMLATAVPQRRPSVGPLLSPQLLADRYNIFGHAQLRRIGSFATGVQPGAKVEEARDYSNGLQQRAMGRRASAHTRLNVASWSVRELLHPGEQWWADISRMHTPDWAGNT